MGLSPTTIAPFNSIRRMLRFTIIAVLRKQDKGDLDAAIVDFNRGIELNPKDAVAYSNRGNTKRDKGDLDGAILDYNHAIRLDPKYAYAYYDRGLAKKQKSDLDGAIVDYNRVIELDPKFAKAYLRPRRGQAKKGRSGVEHLATTIARRDRSEIRHCLPQSRQRQG